MATYARNVWNQLKSITADRLIKALNRDGWIEEETGASTRAYIKLSANGNVTRRIVLHYHPRKTYGPGLLKGLLKEIGWAEQDLKRL